MPQYFKNAVVFSKECVHFFKAQDTPHCSQYFRNIVFQSHRWTCKTKDSSNTDGSTSFALIMRITMIVIKQEVEIKSLLSRSLEKKKFLMYKQKNMKRDYKIRLCGIFMLKLQTQGNTLGQRSTPGFCMHSSGDPW